MHHSLLHDLAVVPLFLAEAANGHGSLLHDLAVILLTAGVVTVIFHKLRQPVVLGYILAGILVGHYAPAAIRVEDKDTIHVLSEFGVILLMFGLGLHFSLKQLVSVGATAFIAAAFEILVMFGLGFLIGEMLGWKRMDSIFLGAILSISSTTIIIKALQELGLTKKPFAQLIFGILIVEDILGIAMIALLSSIAATGTLSTSEVFITLGQLSVFLAATLVGGLLLVPRLLRFVARFRSDEVLLVTSLGLCFGVSLLALLMGYSVALGAFLIGAIVAEAREHGKVESLVAPVRDMFSAVFFVAIGMLIDPKMLITHAWPITIITLAVVFGKVFSCGFGTLVAGNDTRTSMRVGMGLAQIGEFSFIIAALGQRTGVTSDFLYPVAVAVSAVTTLLTPYLIKSSDPFVNVIDRSGPKWLTGYLNAYNDWVARRKARPRTVGAARKLLRKLLLQLGLNAMLLTAFFVAATAINRQRYLENIKFPNWIGGQRGALFLTAALLALPLTIAFLRKLRATAMLLAEMNVTPPAGKEASHAMRAVVANIILSAGVTLLILWILTLSWAILPPWPILCGLLMVIVLVAAGMWQRFVRIYAKAQLDLRETLAEEAAHDHSIVDLEAHDTLPNLLRGAEMTSVEIAEGAPAAGRLIRELALRTRTGSSVVGIDRHGESIINPGPDEEIRPGDRILLIGSAAQLTAGRAALAG